MVPTTVEDDIRSGKGRQISHRSVNHELILEYKYGDKGLKMPCESIISKYKEYFDNYIYTVPLDQNDQVRYRYAPKIVSQDFYGTVAFWSIILFINECHSIIEFEPTELKYVDPKYIRDLIEEIFILEEK